MSSFRAWWILAGPLSSHKHTAWTSLREQSCSTNQSVSRLIDQSIDRCLNSWDRHKFNAWIERLSMTESMQAEAILTRTGRTTAAWWQTPAGAASGRWDASSPTCPQTGGSLCSEGAVGGSLKHHISARMSVTVEPGQMTMAYKHSLPNSNSEILPRFWD